MWRKAMTAWLVVVSTALVLAQAPAAPTNVSVNAALVEASAETAHIWVDTNGGTCTDSATLVAYSDAAACGSLDAANDIADNGDVIRVKGGTYSGQTISGGNSRTSRATVSIATGETMIIDGSFQFDGARYLTVDGGGTQSVVAIRAGTLAETPVARMRTTVMGSDDNPDAPQNQFPCNTFGGSFEVTLRGSDCGGWLILDSNNVTYAYNDIGPCDNTDEGDSDCDNGSIEYCEVAEIGCLGYNEGHTVEYNYIHDFLCDDNFFDGDGDCHWECMYVSYASGLTVRGNWFTNCSNGGNIFHTFSNGGGSFTADFGFRNYIIENNVFELSCNNVGAPCGGRTAEASGFGHCNLFSGTDFTNVLIRFNTFLGAATFGMDNDCSSAGAGSVVFTGNIRGGGSSSCANAWTTGPRPTFEYEIIYNAGGACTGTGNTYLGGGSDIDGLVVDGENGGDPHLLNNGNTAIDQVPDASCSVTVDFEGDARSGDCDAGADQL